MKGKSFFERGSIMVEVIAVLALLGTMSMLMFRQIQQRNEELDNINIASEIRMVKEATIAYIQANKAVLEDRCVLADSDDIQEWELDNGEIEDFLPEYVASTPGKEDGVIHDYKIWATCYLVNPAIAPRKTIYGTIIPNEGAFGDLSLRRVTRIANLIGSDGGVFFPDEGDDKLLHGTMAAWEVNCPGSACSHRDDTFFVATTGMDIYIPEAELEATNAVKMPTKLAFSTLHSTDYFSVGEGHGSVSCVDNFGAYDEEKFAHESLDDNGFAYNDTLKHAGTDGCDPLFWVGVSNARGVDSDALAQAGHVFIKNNLYIGRDTASDRQTVAVETGDTDSQRKITVYSENGKERLTLNANGQIVGRSNGQTGYLLDPVEGEILLYDEAEIDTGSGTKKSVRVPTLRLKNGMMETGKEVSYLTSNAGDPDNTEKKNYNVDPAYTSVMNDIRLISRGGAKLSDILPDYIAKTIDSKTIPDESVTPPSSPLAWQVSKPVCPGGYVRAIMVTPVSWSQYVTNAELKVHVLGQTETGGSGTAAHPHDINFTVDVSKNNSATGNNHVINVTGTSPNTSSLKLVQKEPLSISIEDKTTYWDVAIKYGSENPTDDDKVSALAQTYCVYDAKNFEGTGTNSDEVKAPAYAKEEGEGHSSTPPSDRGKCNSDADCSNSEYCESGTGTCTAYGSCTEDNGQPVAGKGPHYYCINKKIVYIECTEDGDCGGKTCSQYRCK